LVGCDLAVACINNGALAVKITHNIATHSAEKLTIDFFANISVFNKTKISFEYLKQRQLDVSSGLLPISMIWQISRFQMAI
jgi:hypothetical protein